MIFFLTFYFGLLSSGANRNIASQQLYSKIIILYPEAFLLFAAVLVLIGSDVFIGVLINIAWLRQTLMTPGRNTVSEGDTGVQNLDLAFSFCLFSSLMLFVSSVQLTLIKVDIKGLFSCFRLMMVLKM